MTTTGTTLQQLHSRARSSLVSPRLRPDDIDHAATFEALYVHVPFCFHKCHYCDFYSITRQTPERMANFVDLMLTEASLWSTSAENRDGPTCRPKTVFFGGGTPSLLPIDQIIRLIDGLRERFEFRAIDEFTVECNPATVDGEYLSQLRSAGVDRLSFGAQSFNSQELKTLERHHEPDDVERSIELARAAGFSRLNVDLIYAIPGQTLESWLRSLSRAVALKTEHLSCYGLTYEANTPLAVKKRLGQMIAAEDAVELEMLHACRALLAGHHYLPYEISNYARPDEACRHNLCYWMGGNYLSLGPSGASHMEGIRFRNSPHLGDWEQAIGRGELPTVDVERLEPEQRRDELAMTMLRLDCGVEFDAFSGRTGRDARTVYASGIAHLSRLGLIEVDNQSIRLTPSGLNVADAVALELVSG